MKLNLSYFAVVLFLLFSSPLAAFAQHKKSDKFTIVVDPGHGGADVGAIGSFSREKDVTLSVGLKLRDALQKAFPNVNTVMTRTTDVTQNVKAKANIANNAGGSLFISIHCNAAPRIQKSEMTGYKTQTYYTGKGKKRKKRTRNVPVYRRWSEPNPAKGTETFIWSTDKVDSKTNALRDNEQLYMDEEMIKELANFDPDSPEKNILYTLRSKQYFTRSANLAKNIEQEFIKTGRESRMAKQRNKGIWVLQATAMPSVLIEIGFISNPEEERYLNSREGQTEIVNAIANAVGAYLRSMGSY